MKRLKLAAIIGLFSPLPATAHPTHDLTDPHRYMEMRATSKRVAQYSVPAVSLVRSDGKTVSLPEELNDGRLVVLDFIYTSCKESCPLVSKTLSQLQDALGKDRGRVHLVSITIDPEQDTVKRLAAYAKKYHAGRQWQHYTGTLAASITVQRAFDAYRGDKMEHDPVTYLRAAPGKPWLRIDGFVTAKELLTEIRGML